MTTLSQGLAGQEHSGARTEGETIVERDRSCGGWALASQTSNFSQRVTAILDALERKAHSDLSADSEAEGVAVAGVLSNIKINRALPPRHQQALMPRHHGNGRMMFFPPLQQPSPPRGPRDPHCVSSVTALPFSPFLHPPRCALVVHLTGCTLKGRDYNSQRILTMRFPN